MKIMIEIIKSEYLAILIKKDLLRKNKNLFTINNVRNDPQLMLYKYRSNKNTRL